jgi:hypothetical protein
MTGKDVQDDRGAFRMTGGGLRDDGKGYSGDKEETLGMRGTEEKLFFILNGDFFVILNEGCRSEGSTRSDGSPCCTIDSLTKERGGTSPRQLCKALQIRRALPKTERVK